MTRRSFAKLISAASWGYPLEIGRPLLANAVAGNIVAVITMPEVDAYAQALRGIREELPEAVVWDSRDEASLRAHFAQAMPTLAISVGSAPMAALRRVAHSSGPAIYALVLESDLERLAGTPMLGPAVTIDIPPDLLLGEVVRLFPGKTRIGVIRGPAQTDSYINSLLQAGRRLALSIDMLECQRARDLMEVFLKFKSRVDLVWCPADASLYNSATLKPLLISSLTNRIPVIGFSEQLVEAGALFGGSPDFVALGRQIGEVALKIAHGENVSQRQVASRFRFAYNQRVARMLGLKATLASQDQSRMVVFR